MVKKEGNIILKRHLKFSSIIYTPMIYLGYWTFFSFDTLKVKVSITSNLLPEKILSIKIFYLRLEIN